jgi:hypothetical protein
VTTSVPVEKRILIADGSARRLEELAKSTGQTESRLVEAALQLLFREGRPLLARRMITPADGRMVLRTPVPPDSVILTEE